MRYSKITKENDIWIHGETWENNVLMSKWMRLKNDPIPHVSNMKKYLKTRYGLTFNEKMEFDLNNLFDSKWYDLLVFHISCYESSQEYLDYITFLWLNKESSFYYDKQKNLYDIFRNIQDGKITKQDSKDILDRILEKNEEFEKIIVDNKYKKVDDIESIVDRIIDENRETIEKTNKIEKVRGWLTGQVMKATQGKCDPKKVAEIILKKAVDN